MANGRMTERQFADEVGVSYTTVGRKRRARQIQYHRDSWRIYYLPEDVQAWQEQMKHEPIWKSRDLRKAG
jgi:hypothetical protein